MPDRIEVRQGSIEEIMKLAVSIPEFSAPFYSREEYRQRLEGKTHLILTGTVDGRPSGFKIGYEEGPGFYSWFGGVLPYARRKKLATALAEYQEDWVFKRGYTTLWFKTRNIHTGMLTFALKRGFMITKVEPREQLSDFRIFLEKQRLP